MCILSISLSLSHVPQHSLDTHNAGFAQALMASAIFNDTRTCCDSSFLQEKLAVTKPPISTPYL